MSAVSLHFVRKPLLAAALIALGVAIAPSAQAADPDRHMARDQGEHAAPDMNAPGGPEHIEGSIAYLHTELGITPEQEKLWAPVADAMRADVRDMAEADSKTSRESSGHENTIQYLQNRAYFANLRAQGEARFLAAMQPLYENFSKAQKHAADELLAPDGMD